MQTGHTEQLAPLSLSDSQAFLTGLSDAERGCILESFQPLQLATLLQSPEMASPRDLQDLNLCLRDKTLLRIFLGELIGQTEPLSGEASACVQDNFSELNVRSMTIVQLPDEGGQAAMAGSMGAFLLAMSCLGDDEWDTTASGLGLNSSDRASQECALAALGGKAGVVRALQSGEGLGSIAIVSAAQECDVQLSRMGSADVSVATAGSGMIAPLNPADPMAFLAGLPEAEQACISGIMSEQELAALLANPESGDSGKMDQGLQCFSDETLLRIFVTDLIGLSAPLSADTSMCIRGGTAGVDLRSMMSAGGEGNEQDAMVSVMSPYLILSCLNDEEWRAASAATGMDPDGQKDLQCVISELGGPEEMASALTSEDASGIVSVFSAALRCGVQLEMGAGPSG